MGLVIESAFNAARLGGLKMRIGSDTITSSVSSPGLTHSNWSGVAGIGTPNVFDVNLEVLIQFGTGDANYSLDYSEVNREYTLAHTTTNFTVDFSSDGPQGYMMRSVLGFSGDLSGAKTYTSDVTPWFTIEAPLSCKTNEVLDYEDGEMFFGGNSNGLIWSGYPFEDTSYTPTSTSVKRYDFRIEYIPRADLFTHEAVSATPWTWEKFWAHHRTGQPFFYTDPTTGDDMGHKFRKDGSSFRPTPRHPNLVDEYHLDFRTYVFR